MQALATQPGTPFGWCMGGDEQKQRGGGQGSYFKLKYTYVSMTLIIRVGSH